MWQIYIYIRKLYTPTIINSYHQPRNNFFLINSYHQPRNHLVNRVIWNVTNNYFIQPRNNFFLQSVNNFIIINTKPRNNQTPTIIIFNQFQTQQTTTNPSPLPPKPPPKPITRYLPHQTPLPNPSHQNPLPQTSSIHLPHLLKPTHTNHHRRSNKPSPNAGLLIPPPTAE